MKFEDFLAEYAESSLRSERGHFDDIFEFVMDYNLRTLTHGQLVDNCPDGLSGLEIPFEDKYCRELFVCFYENTADALDYHCIIRFLDFKVAFIMNNKSLTYYEAFRLYILNELLKKSWVGFDERFLKRIEWMLDIANPIVTHNCYNRLCEYYERMKFFIDNPPS